MASFRFLFKSLISCFEVANVVSDMICFSVCSLKVTGYLQFSFLTRVLIMCVVHRW